VAAGKRNGKYWANLQNGGLEIELNKDNVPSDIQQEVSNIAAKVKNSEIQTDPLGPLVIGGPLLAAQTGLVTVVLQQARRVHS
jgi:hypothetical protein